MVLEEGACLWPSRFRIVAQGEQGLGASVLLACPDDGDGVRGGQVLPTGSRWLGERAVGAGVLAQRRHRYEYLAREGDGAPFAFVSQSLRFAEKPCAVHLPGQESDGEVTIW